MEYEEFVKGSKLGSYIRRALVLGRVCGGADEWSPAGMGPYSMKGM